MNNLDDQEKNKILYKNFKILNENFQLLNKNNKILSEETYLGEKIEDFNNKCNIDDVKPKVISLDGEWGVGKTFFIDEYIKRNDKTKENSSFKNSYLFYFILFSLIPFFVYFLDTFYLKDSIHSVSNYIVSCYSKNPILNYSITFILPIITLLFYLYFKIDENKLSDGKVFKNIVINLSKIISIASSFVFLFYTISYNYDYKYYLYYYFLVFASFGIIYLNKNLNNDGVKIKVSLFNAKDKDDLENKVFNEILNNLKNDNLLNSFLSKINFRLNLFFFNIGNKDNAFDSALKNNVFNKYLSNSIIFFDDIERKNPTFTIKEFYGFVDELKNKYKTKSIVLVSNKNKFNIEFNGVDQKHLNEYQEKIINYYYNFKYDNDQIKNIINKQILDSKFVFENKHLSDNDKKCINEEVIKIILDEKIYNIRSIEFMYDHISRVFNDFKEVEKIKIYIRMFIGIILLFNKEKNDEDLKTMQQKIIDATKNKNDKIKDSNSIIVSFEEKHAKIFSAFLEETILKDISFSYNFKFDILRYTNNFYAQNEIKNNNMFNDSNYFYKNQYISTINNGIYHEILNKYLDYKTKNSINLPEFILNIIKGVENKNNYNFEDFDLFRIKKVEEISNIFDKYEYDKEELNKIEDILRDDDILINYISLELLNKLLNKLENVFYKDMVDLYFYRLKNKMSNLLNNNNNIDSFMNELSHYNYIRSKIEATGSDCSVKYYHNCISEKVKDIFNDDLSSNNLVNIFNNSKIDVIKIFLNNKDCLAYTYIKNCFKNISKNKIDVFFKNIKKENDYDTFKKFVGNIDDFVFLENKERFESSFKEYLSENKLMKHSFDSKISRINISNEGKELLTKILNIADELIKFINIKLQGFKIKGCNNIVDFQKKYDYFKSIKEEFFLQLDIDKKYFIYFVEQASAPLIFEEKELKDIRQYFNNIVAKIKKIK